jgi:cell wall-associated NlpC family hydrolase
MTSQTMCARRTEDQERAAVIAEARSWLGTPYHHMARVKKHGVDCAMLLAEVYERAGVIAHVEVETYSIQWHLHRSEEKLMQTVSQYGHEVEAGKAGDIVLFKFGRAFSHGGILVSDGIIVHAQLNVGTTLDDIKAHSDLVQRDKKFFSCW